jgi:hypothetical protein
VRRRLHVRRRAATALFLLRPVALLTRRRHALVLGDSHAEVFAGWRPRGWRFKVVAAPGATASGIRNPNSRTEALPRFRRALRWTRPWQTVVAMLGEVDCGYVIWLRAGDGDPTPALEEAIGRYCEFLAREVAPAARELLVVSAPLPTLPDDASTWGEVARRRADVQRTQAERTAMTLRFNAALRERCDAAGWRFVDATTAQLDPATGLVRAALVRPGASDHHLRDAPLRAILEARLSPAAPSPPRPSGPSG